MLSKAIGKYIRISPSKTRLVMNLVKGKTAEEAGYILDNTNKNVCEPIKKVLDSAFANANFNRQDKFLLKDLFVSNIKADVGPMLQRYRAASMGRATPIRHRTAHITIELDKIVKVEPKKKETTDKKEAAPKKKTAAKKEGK